MIFEGGPISALRTLVELKRACPKKETLRHFDAQTGLKRLL
jgi:hypothetical protein